MPLPRARAIALASCLLVSLSWSPEIGLAPVPVAASAADDLTVISLNLALREDVDSIAAGMRAIGADDADVIVLQEVVETPGRENVASQLAGKLGLTAVYRPSFTLDDGRASGQATLSRVPIIDVRVLPLKKFSLSFRSRDARLSP